jgi:hypothetical protein
MKTLPGWVNKYLPPRGPCSFCGGLDARHRLIDMITDRHCAGDSVSSLAEDYGLPAGFVRRIIRLTARPSRT